MLTMLTGDILTVELEAHLLGVHACTDHRMHVIQTNGKTDGDALVLCTRLIDHVHECDPDTVNASHAVSRVLN
jgi:hypothetical protein